MEKFIVEESTAQVWHREPRFGLRWERTTTIDGWGGLGTRERVGMGEFVPNGPPKSYLVTITPTFGAIDWYFPGSVNEGVVRARIISSVGQARHELICDAFAGGICVPGGIIQVGFEQTDAVRRVIDFIDISIAVATSNLDATYTIPCPLTDTPEPGYPADYLEFDSSANGQSLPVQARIFVLTTIPSDGTYTVEFWNHYGDQLALYNTATDPELRANGVLIPIGTDSFTVTGKATTCGPIATLRLR